MVRRRVGLSRAEKCHPDMKSDIGVRYPGEKFRGEMKAGGGSGYGSGGTSA